MQQTVADFFSLWLDLRRSSLSPSTICGYSRTLRLHILPNIGTLPLDQVSAFEIMRCCSGSCAVGQTRAAQLTLVLLHAAFSDAFRMGLISRNPAEGIKRPKHVTSAIAFWDRDTICVFLGAPSTRADPLYHVWLLALLCGLRRGELLGLRWQDIEWGKGILHIRNQRLLIEGRLIDAPPKTASSRRDILLPAQAVAALRCARRAHGLGCVYCCALEGKPLSPQQLRRAFNRAADAAGVPRLHLHGMRHSMATAAHASGIDLLLLQHILGHSKMATTADFYSHPAIDEQGAALATFAESVL